MRLRVKHNPFVNKLPACAVLLALSFMLLGIIELYNKAFFQILHLGVFPSKLWPHFFPILAMYLLKSMEYVTLFFTAVLIIIVASKIILMFAWTKQKQQLAGRLETIAATFYDLLPPFILIFLLFFEYRSAPFSLLYYFYYLSDTVSPLLNTIFGYNTLIMVIKIILSAVIVLLFIKFRFPVYS